MVYMATLPGGWIADRLIGQRRAVLYGGILIASGHFSMALSVADHVLSRPRAHRHRHRTAEGQRQRHRRPALRAPDDNRRDAGFSIFYMGINTRRVHRAAHLRLPRPADQLAPRVRGRRRRHGVRRHSIRARRQRTWVDAGLQPGGTVVADGYRDAVAAQATLWGGISARRMRGRSACGGSIPACSPSRATQIADAAGILSAAVITVVFFGWLFFGSDWTPAERKRLYASSACCSSRRRCSGRCSSRRDRR